MAVWKTQIFNGGINNWTDPSLLESNQCVNLQNADVSTGKIISLKRPLKMPSDDPEYYGHYGTANRSLIKWYDRYYWSNNTAIESPFYGGYPENYLGIPYPAYSGTSANVAAEGQTLESGETGLTGTFKYCVTFVNENGWEGAPGSPEEYETALELSSQVGEITVSWPSTDDRIEYAKIYRTGNKGADYYCVGEIRTSGGSLRDTTSDELLTALNPLTTIDNMPPPDEGKYLTEYNGVFFLACGSLLYYSVQGNPHAWPITQFLNLDDTITGIAAEFQGILVFTQNSVFRVVGAESPATLTKTYIPGNHGCINFRSIAVLNNAPIWFSNDGICLWDGSSIGVVSYGRMKTTGLGITYAASANDQYFLFHTKGGIIFDRRNGDIFEVLSFTCDYAWYDSTTDNLFLKAGNSLYQYGRGEKELEYRYVSPMIGDQSMKIWREIHIWIDGDGKISYSIDGQTQKKIDLVQGRNRLKLPFDSVGRKMQLTITGTGILHEVLVINE